MSNSSCETKCSLDWAFAHLILRLWVGLRLLMAGIDKMREKGGSGFGLDFISTNMEKITKPILDNTMIPAWAVAPYAKLLPFALLIAGAAILIGICTRWSLLVGGLIFVSLASGLMALPDDDQAVFRGIEVALTALALMTAAHNKFSVDGLLFAKKGGCCAKEGAAE